MKESYIENTCVNYARLFGVKSIKLSIQSNVGYPDRLFIVDGGKPMFVEFKSPGGKLSKKQEVIIDDLRQKGYNVSVCNSIETFKQMLENILK